MTRPSLAARYRAGEHEEVWRLVDVAQHADEAFRRSPECHDLLDQTFGGVRRSIETIVGRLRELGYVFECEDRADPERRAAERLLTGQPAPHLPAVPPVCRTSRDAEFVIDWCGQRLGHFPEALSAFSRLVGQVDLRQTHRASRALTGDPVVDWLGDWDPLFFDLDYTAYMIREEGADLEEQPGGGLAFEIEFAPDAYHKADISGGEGYAVFLPSSRIDPIVRLPSLDFAGGRRPDEMPFTTWLRRTIGRGGFFGVPHLMLDRGHGWLGRREVDPGIFLPDHPVFETLSRDLPAF